MPTVTRNSVIMRPRRLRSSRNRVVISANVGIGEPRLSGGVAGSGSCGTGASTPWVAVAAGGDGDGDGQVRGVDQGAGPVRIATFDLQGDGRPGEELGDRSLPDDGAVV